MSSTRKMETSDGRKNKKKLYEFRYGLSCNFLQCALSINPAVKTIFVYVICLVDAT